MLKFGSHFPLNNFGLKSKDEQVSHSQRQLWPAHASEYAALRLLRLPSIQGTKINTVNNKIYEFTESRRVPYMTPISFF